MRGAIALLDIISYTLGTLAVYSALMLSRRDRDRIYAREALLMTAFMCILAALGAQEFHADLLFPAHLIVEQVRRVVMFAGVCLMVHAVPSYLEALHSSRATRIAANVMSVVAVGLGLAWILLIIAWNVDLTFPIFVAMLAGVTWTIAFSFFLLAKRGWKRLEPDGIRILVLIAVTSLVLMPLIVMSDYFGLSIAALPTTQRHYLFLPIFYAIWAGLLLASRSRLLASREASPAPSEAIVVVPAEAAARFREAYDVSEREYEVLELLVQGFSYSRIADRLCISHSTAKSHAASIYRKTGAKGKIELVHMVHEGLAVRHGKG